MPFEKGHFHSPGHMVIPWEIILTEEKESSLLNVILTKENKLP